MECEEKIRGTKFKQVLESDGGACLRKYKTEAKDCGYVVRGVSGGPVRYPTVTTGVDVADNGEDDQVCFAFANLRGEKIKDAELLPRILDLSWDGIGTSEGIHNVHDREVLCAWPIALSSHSHGNLDCLSCRSSKR